jgi:hypothetical protein
MNTDKVPLPKFFASDLVKDAITNAEIVLAYTAEAGIDVNISDVEIITKAKELLLQNEWNSQIEIEFWNAYKNLTALIQPVSVDSLRASQETVIKNPNIFQKIFRKKRRETLAYRVVRFYTIFAVITMLLMLVLHIYFSIGTIRLNRIQSADERIKDIESQLDEIELIIGTSSNLSAQQKQDHLQNELFEVNTEKESNIKLLGEWVAFVQDFFFMSNKEAKQMPQEQTQAGNPAPPAPQNFPASPEATLDKNIEIIQKAQNYVLIIGLYVLPLFYGLLGALTYVLRDLSNQTHKMQYTKESNINHILRLILGTIAGLAVGVFWGDLKQQESFIIIRSLGPLIVAYLSGLTVEYVFTAIEKWIGSVINKALNTENK